MHWSNTFFAHWRVPAAPLASHLPDGLRLELHRGEAWVSIAAMRVRGPFPGPFPPPPLDPVFAVDQISIRTYVIGPEGPGVFLLDSVLNGRIAAFMGRQAGLPYRYSRSTHVHRGAQTLSVLSPGLSVYGDLGPTLRLARPGSRLHFLSERYRVYTQLPGGFALGSLTIAHDPWRLRRVELGTSLPSSIAGFPGSADPALVLAGASDLHVTVSHVASHTAPIVRELREMATELTH